MIKAQFIPPSKASVDALKAACREKMRNIVITRLTEIGKESVEIARSLPDKGGTYKNRTGRLHNSIGFLVTADGQPVTEDFISAEGRQCAMAQVGKYGEGFALIIVAGAEYAMDVHVRGYDVLDSAVINAERQFKEFCDKINAQ